MSEENKHPEWILLWEGYTKAIESWRLFLEHSQDLNNGVYEIYKNAFEKFMDSWQKTCQLYSEEWQIGILKGSNSSTPYLEMVKKFSEPWIKKTLQ